VLAVRVPDVFLKNGAGVISRASHTEPEIRRVRDDQARGDRIGTDQQRLRSGSLSARSSSLSAGVTTGALDEHWQLFCVWEVAGADVEADATDVDVLDAS